MTQSKDLILYQGLNQNSQSRRALYSTLFRCYGNNLKLPVKDTTSHILHYFHAKDYASFDRNRILYKLCLPFFKEFASFLGLLRRLNFMVEISLYNYVQLYFCYLSLTKTLPVI